MIQKSIGKKIALTAIPVLAVFGLLASLFSEPDLDKKKSDKQTSKQEATQTKQNKIDPDLDLDSNPDPDSHSHSHSNQTHKASKKDFSAFPKDFDYNKEAKDLAELKATYPRSESQLMNMILAKNEFSGAAPHSAAELAERQKGALKVEALRALIELNEDKEALSRNLLKIAESSKDPVMKRIASAALESQSKGRPFFSDTIRALGDLPIPE